MFIPSQNNLNVKSQLSEIVQHDFNDNRKKDKGGIVVEKVQQVITSQSGAVSAEVMHYKLQRARERQKDAEMEALEKIEREKEEFEQRRIKRLIPHEEFQNKKREKRIKKQKNKEQNKQKYELKQKASIINQFQNDGNFMENFLKMQQEQNQNNKKQE